MSLEGHAAAMKEPIRSAPPKTGWPAPALMQDDSRPLFRWFAGRPDARRRVREAAAPPVPDCEETMGLFGSGVFWIAGLICLGLWGWLAYYVAVLP